MPDKDEQRVSHRLVNAFQARERREIEALRAEFGSELIDKLDRVILRDLIAEQRSGRVGEVDGKEPETRRHRVMVNMKSGAPRRGAQARIGDQDARREVVTLRRRSAELAFERLRSTARASGAEILQEFWLTHSALVLADQAQLIALAARRDVKSLNHAKRAHLATLNSSVPVIGSTQVINTLGYDGSGVQVAVLDTGVDFTHPALTPGQGAQWDFTGEGTGDLFGHGSHCAGVVASRDLIYRGVAPGATVHDYKILDADGNGDAPGAVSAIQQAVADGLHVLSNSWGWSHANHMWECKDGACVLCSAADVAASCGVVFVVSAGNDNNSSCPTPDTHIGCPGNARDAITVAATDDADAMADFSSIGPTPDGRAKPDLTAPGVDVLSVRALTGSNMGDPAPTTDGDFIQASGTSMSCPHVAGVCALMLSKNSTLTPAALKSALMSTSINVGHTADEMGAGRVDALASVNAV